jgi:hypothetical protein
MQNVEGEEGLMISVRGSRFDVEKNPIHDLQPAC